MTVSKASWQVWRSELLLESGPWPLLHPHAHCTTVPVLATPVLSGLAHGAMKPAWNLLSVHLKMKPTLMMPFSICRAPVCQDCHVPPGLICHALWPARPHTTSELQPSAGRCEASLTLLPPQPSIPSAFQ